MLLILIYLFANLMIWFFIYKLRLLIRDEQNKYAIYFIYSMIIMGIGEIIGLLLLIVYYFSQQPQILYWLDVITRAALCMGSVLLIQMPLYLFFANRKSRYLYSVIFLLMALALFFYNLTLKYQPYIDQSGYIHWEAPIVLSIGFAVVAFSAWLSTAFIFLIDFINGKFENLKSLFLSIGFIMIGIGIVFQDFVKSDLLFGLLYITMISGGLIIFFALKGKPKKRKQEK